MAHSSFSADEYTVENPTNARFHLHNHDDYEIYMFLEGDSSYRVEGTDYPLEPRDVIVIRKHQMHRVFQNGPSKYRRIVLMISPRFFTENNCREYESQFAADTDIGNKICADTVMKSGLYDAFIRLKRCSGNFSDLDSPVARATVVEILYLISSVCTFTAPESLNTPAGELISYINNHYTEKISLDDLGKRFFISKCYLCRIFRRATGLTVHRYIMRKRLTLIRELTAQGKNLSEAAEEAGFVTYSSFYRTHIAEFGVPPSDAPPVQK